MIKEKLVATKGWRIFAIVLLLSMAASILLVDFSRAEVIWTVAVALSIFLMIAMALNKGSALFDFAVWIVFYSLLYKIISVTGVSHKFVPLWFVLIYVFLYAVVSGILYKQPEVTKYLYTLALMGWFILIERHIRIDGFSWSYYGEIPMFIRRLGYPALGGMFAISAVASFFMLKNRAIWVRLIFGVIGTMLVVSIVGGCLQKEYLFTIFVVAYCITLTFLSPAANQKVSAVAEKTVDKVKEKMKKKNS